MMWKQSWLTDLNFQKEYAEEDLPQEIKDDDERYAPYLMRQILTLNTKASVNW